jgi:hypothetical protein
MEGEIKGIKENKEGRGEVGRASREGGEEEGEGGGGGAG